MTIRIDGSFKDPGGYVFLEGENVYRTINASAEENFQFVLDSGVYESLFHKNHLIGFTQLEKFDHLINAFKGPRGEIPSRVLQHPKLPFISYVYEWTFQQLKDATLCHLDIQIDCLEQNIVLSDATPFNIQFVDGRPLHIDVLSFRRYKEGEIWGSYNQFSRLFLLPLLIEAWAGVPFQPLLRGCLEGIKFEDAVKILPKSKLFFNLHGLMHVYLQHVSIAKANSSPLNKAESVDQFLPKAKYKAILTSLRDFVAELRSNRPTSYWSGYDQNNTYVTMMRQKKMAFVSEWASQLPLDSSILDVGGNSGDYSVLALEARAKHAFVIDSDLDSLERAYKRARILSNKNLLPLYIDLADPSPSLGWKQKERMGFNERVNVNGILFLAVIHHLVIGRNIPLQELVQWIIATSPSGIIEFVPKSDPMVKQMLSNREDIFTDYDETCFKRYVTSSAEIVREIRFEQNDRYLIEFKRL